MVNDKIVNNLAVLVGLITSSQPEDRTREYLDELAFLADTNHIQPVKRFVQRLESPNSTTYVGEGKLKEIRDYIAVYNEDNTKTTRRRHEIGCWGYPTLKRRTSAHRTRHLRRRTLSAPTPQH